jgi:hypothetical protein
MGVHVFRDFLVAEIIEDGCKEPVKVFPKKRDGQWNFRQNSQQNQRSRRKGTAVLARMTVEIENGIDHERNDADIDDLVNDGNPFGPEQRPECKKGINLKQDDKNEEEYRTAHATPKLRGKPFRMCQHKGIFNKFAYQGSAVVAKGKPKRP